MPIRATAETVATIAPGRESIIIVIGQAASSECLGEVNLR